MKEGWLWLSILKIAASPSPMSTTPAFSPGPQMTRGPVVGSRFSHFFEDLYEQCSLHITEKMPSSVMFGARPMMRTARSYSSGVRPCSLTMAGVMGCSDFNEGLDCGLLSGPLTPTLSPVRGRGGSGCDG